MTSWGQWGSATGHERYAIEAPRRPGRRRRCSCGCGGPQTHVGMANGVGLMGGCALSVKRWVRDGWSRNAT